MLGKWKMGMKRVSFGNSLMGWVIGLVWISVEYFMVVVSGGMNQQRNQIVDAVVIARILGAALLVPILLVNVIWG
ncbi:hypothetical protein FXO37_07899 [Capsicum annuum]|nr:hypothetical protein FXO37_07899 [Capsicum annuum]